MKKTRIFAVLAAMALGLAVFGCSNGDSDSSESGSTGGTTSGSIKPNPEGFVKIPAASIDGTESWKPNSEVFVSGRKLEIASFYMSDHLVTRGEYKALMGEDPSYASAYDKDGKKLTGDDNVKNNPVNYINWYDALVYCNTRSIQEKLTPVIKLTEKQTRANGEKFRRTITARGMPRHATLQRTATACRQRRNGNGLRAAAKATPMPEATI